MALLKHSHTWFDICYIAALFCISKFLRPSPPSYLGRRIEFQATLTPGLLRLPPFHKKGLRICSNWMMTLLGEIKREDHYMTLHGKNNWINYSNYHNSHNNGGKIFASKLWGHLLKKLLLIPMSLRNITSIPKIKQNTLWEIVANKEMVDILLTQPTENTFHFLK